MLYGAKFNGLWYFVENVPSEIKELHEIHKNESCEDIIFS